MIVHRSVPEFRLRTGEKRGSRDLFARSRPATQLGERKGSEHPEKILTRSVTPSTTSRKGTAREGKKNAAATEVHVENTKEGKTQNALRVEKS